jgi:hypothetical protein
MVMFELLSAVPVRAILDWAVNAGGEGAHANAGRNVSNSIVAWFLALVYCVRDMVYCA